MKAVAVPLVDFIKTYNLELPGERVCFDAMVYAYTQYQHFDLQSEVYIITIAAQQADILYIMNPGLASAGFPDMFELRNVAAIFKEKKGLLIKGKLAGEESYSILIQPTGKDCEPPSRDELSGY